MDPTSKKYVYIDHVYDVENFRIPETFKGEVTNVVVPHGMIVSRIEKLAKDILEHYAEETVLHFMIICKGAFAYFAELERAMKGIISNEKPNFKMIYHFIRVSSYKDTNSTGVVTISGMSDDELNALKDQDVLVVEDLVDTGRTLTEFMKKMDTLQCKTVKTTTLFQKRVDAEFKYDPTWVGFSIPNVFVIGFGMDYNEFFRDLPHLCTIHPDAVQKYKSA